MQRILRIDSGACQTGSISRTLGDYLQRGVKERSEKAGFITRDLSIVRIEHIHPNTIAGFGVNPKAMTVKDRMATALSDLLISELQYADTLCITTPLYNFGIPSALKAWIDQIVRMDHTFAFEEGRLKGLARPKLAVICVASGASAWDADRSGKIAGLVDRYFRHLLSFIGIDVIHFVHVQSANVTEASFSMKQAQKKIDDLLDTELGPMRPQYYN